MDTVETAIEYLRHNQTAYWWVFSGNSKIAECTNTDNVEDSISRFREASRFWPSGSYKLECSDKAANRSGSFKFPFSKGQGQPTSQSPTPMAQSNNAYGIPDHVLLQIQNETRRTLLFEQMHDKFGPMVDLVKDLEKRVEKLEKILADEDEDGTPDILEMTRKGAELAKAGSEIKRVFEGGKLF